MRLFLSMVIAICLVTVLATCAAAAPPGPVLAVAQQPDYKIVTASERGTYIVLGRDLAAMVAPDAGFGLEAIPSAGASENIYKLRFEPGVKFAIVQSDVFQAFMDRAEGNRDSANLIKPLRVILPLYNEEMYFIARSDSPMNYIHEIRGARVSVPYGSGAALSAVTLYQAMFRAPIRTPTYQSNEDGLVQLLGDKSVDVVVVVAGQPMKLLADMKPEAKQLIKLLRFDDANPASKEALRIYFAATIRASSYPNLLSDDIPALAVKAFLVTYDFNLQQTRGALARFGTSLCKHLADLQAKGHPKWREVSLDLPELGAGWSYYPATFQAIKACTTPPPQQAAPRQQQRQPRAECAAIEYTLGLCGKP